MHGEIRPIGAHEGVELAETASYYIRRNFTARRLLDQSDIFPSYEDANGVSLMHYETMVIRLVEPVGSSEGGRRVTLHPALPINGSNTMHEMSPITVTVLDGTDVRGGFIAILQRMNSSHEIGCVYFVSDDSSDRSQT